METRIIELDNRSMEIKRAVNKEGFNVILIRDGNEEYVLKDTPDPKIPNIFYEAILDALKGNSTDLKKIPLILTKIKGRYIRRDDAYNITKIVGDDGKKTYVVINAAVLPPDYFPAGENIGDTNGTHYYMGADGKEIKMPSVPKKLEFNLGLDNVGECKTGGLVIKYEKGPAPNGDMFLELNVSSEKYSGLYKKYFLSYSDNNEAVLIGEIFTIFNNPDLSVEGKEKEMIKMFNLLNGRLYKKASLASPARPPAKMPIYIISPEDKIPKAVEPPKDVVPLKLPNWGWTGRPSGENLGGSADVLAHALFGPNPNATPSENARNAGVLAAGMVDKTSSQNPSAVTPSKVVEPPKEILIPNRVVADLMDPDTPMSEETMRLLDAMLVAEDAKKAMPKPHSSSPTSPSF